MLQGLIEDAIEQRARHATEVGLLRLPPTHGAIEVAPVGQLDDGIAQRLGEGRRGRGGHLTLGGDGAGG